MRIWLVKTGEPLPTDSTQRPFRMGMLASALVRRGHSITWWTSTFDHNSKRQLSDSDLLLTIGDGYNIQMIRSPGYRKNASLSRIFDHVVLAHRYGRTIRSVDKPDLIVCAYPTIGLTKASCRYGHLNGVPVVIDIRDLWPNTFAGMVPSAMQTLASIGLALVRQNIGEALRYATALTGVTREYVDWGLTIAQRARGELDREFPLAYVSYEPEPHEQAEASAFWRTQGLDGSGGHIIACFFGTIGRHFDLETVLEAADAAFKTGLPLKVVICGNGDHLEMYRRRASMCSNVLMPGWVDKSKIWTLLRLSSVALAPYVNSDEMSRNVPNKIAEYLSAGLPVVTSLGGNVRTLLEENQAGCWYANGDVAGLVKVMTHFCTDADLRARLTSSAVDLSRRMLSADEVYDAFVSHLETVVGQYSAHVSSVRR